MSLKLITLAALGAAAQASVADPGADQIVANAMEAVAIVASHTRRQLDSRFLATTPYMKAKCIKGYALKRTFPLMDLKFSTSVIIPTTGYCIKGKASAVGYFKLTCDGLTLNGQGGKKVDCSDITATTAKLDLFKTGMGFSCVSTDLVDGVEFSNYKTKGCSDAPATLAVKSDDCMVDGAWGAVSRKFMCNKEKTRVTINTYSGGAPSKCVPKTTNTACSSIAAPANQAACDPQSKGKCGQGQSICDIADGGPAAKCTGTKDKNGAPCKWTSTNLCTYAAPGAKCSAVKNAYTFKSNDGICHNPDTAKATPAPAPAPAPAPSGDASTNALATGFAVAGIIVSLVLM